jgi:hypothetical protein
VAGGGLSNIMMHSRRCPYRGALSDAAVRRPALTVLLSSPWKMALKGERLAAPLAGLPTWRRLVDRTAP